MANTNPKSIFDGSNPNQLLPNAFPSGSGADMSLYPNQLPKAFEGGTGDMPRPMARTLNGSSDQPPVLQRVNLGGSDPLASVLPERPQGQLAKVLHAPSPDERYLDTLDARRQSLLDADARPYGFEGAPPSPQHPNGLAPNHPGAWGHIAHVLSTAGQIAGDIVEPGIMAKVPGTRLNRMVQERADTGEINHEQQLLSENQERDANAAHLQQETENAKRQKYTPLTTDEGDYNYDSSTGTATPIAGPGGKPLQPHDRTKSPIIHESDQGIFMVDPATGQATPLTYQGKPLMPKGNANLHYETVTGPDGKPHTYGLNDKGEKQVDEGTHFEKPVQGPAITMVVPDGSGGGTVERLRPGQTVAPGAMSSTQFGSMNTPTSSTRTMIESAPGVINLANRVKSLVDEQKNSLGPEAGRWNEFMAGKVGAPNPEFTKLRTDVGLLQTKLMRMHVGARGGEQMMAHFKDLIDSSKQSPENLNAALDEIISYANDVQSDGKPGGATKQSGDQNAPQQRASGSDIVYDGRGVGHRYKGPGPRNDPKNWEEVK